MSRHCQDLSSRSETAASTSHNGSSEPASAASSLPAPGPDDPLPSIETSPPAPTRSSPPFVFGSGQPSISFTPPTSGSRGPTPSDRRTVPLWSRSQGGSQSSDLNNSFQTMRLSSSTSSLPPSSLNLSDLSAALNDIATPSCSPTPSSHLGPEAAARASGSPSPSAHRRRRSSPRPLTRHEVRDEEPPSDRFHDPAFQQAFADAKALMAGLAKVLGSSDSHLEPDSVIKGLRERAESLAEFRCPSKRIVGLVGDSGVGKSSLLNSLLDFPGLAQSSNGGEACTCVVTEYHYHEGDDFNVEIELFSDDEIQEQFTHLVHAYRHWHFQSSDIEPEDRDHCEKQAELADHTFSAMFRGRFTTTFLRSDQSEDDIVNTLLNWAQELGPVNINKPKVRGSLKECSDLLLRLTSNQGSPRRPAAWPYTKKIRVFLQAHILRNGLVLVDLPGLRDTNSTRRNITERYLLACDEIFAVCDKGRALTDKGIESVFNLAQQARLSNVSIICTKSDRISAEEEQKNWGGAKATRIGDLLDAVNTAEQELKVLKDELVELEKEGDDLSEEEMADKLDLYREKEMQSNLLKNHKWELKKYIITTRNNFIISGLEEKYGDVIRDGNLRVFCASNAMYWEHREDRVDKAQPFLRLSGILDIRRYCAAMVSESQLRITTSYMRDSVPDLLSNVELWIQSGAGSADAEQKQVIRETLDAIERRLRMGLTRNSSPLNTLKRVFVDQFEESLYKKRQLAVWVRGAQNASWEWNWWAHGSYIAFCNHFGIHETKAVGSARNWNEEAIQTMVKDVAGQWTALVSVIENSCGKAISAVHQTLDAAINHLETTLDNYPESVQPLRQVLTSRRELLSAAVWESTDRFQTRLSKLRTDAFSGLRTSFFGKSMEDTYRHAIETTGAGSWSRKKSIINTALGSEDLFDKLMRKIRKEFWDLATQLQTDVEAAVTEQLNVVKGTLDMVRDENGVLESERDLEFRERVAEGVRRARERAERVQTVAAGA